MSCIDAKFNLVSELLDVKFTMTCIPHDDIYLRIYPPYNDIEIPVDGSAAYINVYTNTNFKFK